MRSNTDAGVPEKSRQLRPLSKLAAALVVVLLMLVGLPASPANAVTAASEAPKLTAVELVSAAQLAPGQTARVRFTLSQPAQRVEFRYRDASLSEPRSLIWTGDPGPGPFIAEATAVIGVSDFYEGLQRLTDVRIVFQKSGQSYPAETAALRNSSSDYLFSDNAGDPLLQNADFAVSNPSRVLRTPQASVLPKFQADQDLWSNWNYGVDGTISPGTWTAGVTKVHVQWVSGGVAKLYRYEYGTEPFEGSVRSTDAGKEVSLRITTVTPGFKSVSAESEPYLFVTSGPIAVSGKPWINSALKASFDVSSIKGIPVGATPKVELFWLTKSTPYPAGTGLAPGVDYVVKDADGGGTVRVAAVVSLEGKVVGRFVSDSTAYVTNPAPSRNYVHREVSDFLMARTTDGRLWMWGRYFGSFPKEVGTGWNVFDKIFSPGDFNEDGHADVLARKPSGELWMYPADGQYWWKPASLVGVGWQGMTELMAPGDFDSDGHDDVLAKDRDGRLLLYPGNGKGGWLAPRQVGAGWNMFNRVFSTGDFDGDSHADILATNAGGQLFLYSSNGKGGWLGSKVIGSGWQSFKGVFGAGDRDYDGWTDIYGIDGAGYMYLYPFKSGSWKPRALVGADWDVFTALF